MGESAEDEGVEALPVGATIGGYAIRRMIGHGGFGITYEAHNPVTGRAVAIKEFFPGGMVRRDGKSRLVYSKANAETIVWALRKFEETTATLSGLQHPNIVQVHDYVPANDTGHMIMELLDGRTLKDWLKARAAPPSLDELRPLVGPVMEALVFVHGRGLIHRDIAPDNILITREGRPVLIDFGSVSRDLSDAKQQNLSSTVGLTKRHYTAPEQMRAKARPTPAADIYSMGAVLYRALSGSEPTDGQERVDALFHAREADPYKPLMALRPSDCPARAMQAIDKALAIRPENRPRSMAELAEALKAAPAAKQPQQRPSPTKNLRPATLLAIAALCVGSACGLWLATSGHRAPQAEGGGGTEGSGTTAEVKDGGTIAAVGGGGPAHHDDRRAEARVGPPAGGSTRLLECAATPASNSEIVGAGAIFPYSIYTKWAEIYAKTSGVRLNYQSIGSGAGVKQIEASTVTFGASDVPLDAAHLQQAALAQWPMVLDAVVPVVNVKGIGRAALTLDGPTLAGIFLGEISTWDDPAIRKLNPDIALPSRDINVVHRSDGSGKTFYLTDYFSKASAAWKSRIGAATSVQWPKGIGAKGNEGVASNVRLTPDSIGYLDFAYAKQSALTLVTMLDKDGGRVEATPQSIAAAAARADWAGTPGFGPTLTDQPGANSWPIATATFVLMQTEPRDADAARTALRFFAWAYQNGDEAAAALDYVPIPKTVAALAEAMWTRDIRGSDGNPLLACSQ